MPPKREPEDDERVSLHPLDPVTALKGLLAVKPDGDEPDEKRRESASDRPKPRRSPRRQ